MVNRSRLEILPVLPAYVSSLATFFVLRVLFLSYNYGLINHASLSDLARAFVNGLIFDSSVAATSLFFIYAIGLLLLPLSRRIASRVFTVLTFTLMAVLFLVNLVDVVYFEFFNSRMNILFLDNLDQMAPIVETVFSDYPVFPVLIVWAIVVVLFIGLFRVLSRYLSLSILNRNFKTSTLLMPVLLFGLSFLWTAEPFWRMNRFSLRDQALNQLSMNGVYTLVKAWDQKKILERDADGVNYDFQPIETTLKEMQDIIIDDSERPIDDMYPFTRKIKDPKPLKTLKPNIVIILMEGFSASYIGSLSEGNRGYSPGFDSLARDGLFFTRIYGHGTRTHHGLVSTVGSFPSLLNMFLTRRRGTESFYTLGSLLRQYGYETSFIYGYDQGFDHMGFFMKQGGIDRIIDQEEFVNPSFRAEWGVSDEDLFQKVDEYFASVPPEKPFFSFILTSSNHTPHEVPEHFSRKHPEYADNKRAAAFAYSDYALSEFLLKAKQADYFKRTIFVIVADHGEILDADDREFKRFHIPCLIYSPALIAEQMVINTVGGQVDIGTTLMHLIGYPGVYHFMGRDLLSLPEDEGWVIVRNDHTVYYCEDNKVLVRDIRDSLSVLYEVDSYSRMQTETEFDNDSLKSDWNHRLETYLQTAHYLYSTGKYRSPLGDLIDWE